MGSPDSCRGDEGADMVVCECTLAGCVLRLQRVS